MKFEKVTIPTWADPFPVTVNGKAYYYPAGETLEVPYEVAEVIRQLEREPSLPPSSGGGGGGSEDLDEVLNEQEALISELQRIISRKVDKTEVPWNDVTFIDYDGTVLYSYTTAEAKALTEMPPLPTQPGLICQGWNYDLDTVKSYDTPVTVGATYITDDGKTRIYITLHEGRTSPMLGCCPNGTVTVDWGDGSEPDVLTGTSTSISAVRWTPTHNYAVPGDYVIRLTVDGEVRLTGTSTSSQYSYLLRYNSGSSNINGGYQVTVNKVEVGENVTIGDSAFSNCRSMCSVTIPNSVTSIGTYAFSDCYSLSSLIIPNSVTSINIRTFDNCYSLKETIIPSSVTSIGGYVFNSCYSINDLKIPSSVTSLGNNAFYNCGSLRSITIPDGVTELKNYTFQGCRSLSGITIPNSVTSIANESFSGCNALRFIDFTSHTSVPTLSNSNVLNNTAADCQIRVPAALYDEWIAATNWSSLASKIVAV